MDVAVLVTAIVSAVGAGLVSSLGTVAALKVHIVYLREKSGSNEAAIIRAHGRIDVIERRCSERGCKHE